MKLPYIPHSIYHVYNRANGSENLFRSPDNYEYFLHKYTQYIKPVAQTFAYCLVPNQFHFLIEVRGELELKDFYLKKANLQGFKNLGGLDLDFHALTKQQFSNFLNAYTKAFNKQQSRSGSLFQQNTKRKVLPSNTYCRQVLHKIHFHPVQLGLAKNLHEWNYSSYTDYLQPKSYLISRETAYDWFGGIQGFHQFHQTYPFA